MKALKTIVATAVIVFALTTVAMAGVQRLGDRAGDQQSGAHMTAVAGTPATAQSTGTVTLSAAQFATLLSAAGGHEAHDQAKHAKTTREKAQQHSRTRTSENGHDGAGLHQSGGGRQQSSGGATHHAVGASAGGHDGALHADGSASADTHEGGTHDDRSHDGGCD